MKWLFWSLGLTLAILSENRLYILLGTFFYILLDLVPVQTWYFDANGDQITKEQ